MQLIIIGQKGETLDRIEYGQLTTYRSQGFVGTIHSIAKTARQGQRGTGSGAEKGVLVFSHQDVEALDKYAKKLMTSKTEADKLLRVLLSNEYQLQGQRVGHPRIAGEPTELAITFAI